MAPPPALPGAHDSACKTAVACGTPDRVPLSLVMDLFAAKTMGVKFSDFAADVDVAGQTMLGALEKLGDVDSIQFATYAPDVLGLLWLAPMKLPGRDLPEDSLWQMDEQVRIQPEDYDRILEMGWSPWFGQYIGKYLGAAAAAGQALQEAGPRWVGGVHEAGLRRLLAHDRRPSLRAPGRRPHGQGVHPRPLPDARQGAGGPGRHHGREAGADPPDRARGRAPSATGWAAGARRPSSSRRGCGTASCGPT